MWETVKCIIGGASWPFQCVLFVVQSDETEKTMLPPMFDDVDGGALGLETQTSSQHQMVHTVVARTITLHDFIFGE